MPPPGEMARCLQLIRVGHYADARARLEPIVKDHPDWPRANLLLAMTYHEEHRYELAEPLFAKTLELKPDNHVVRLFYGWCLYYLGKLDEAQEMFDVFLKAKPGFADAYFGLGLIEYDRDHMDLATQRLNSAIESAAAVGDKRTEGKARARLADVFIRENDLTAARRELELAVKLRPDAYEAYFKLSRVLARMGERESAAEAMETFQRLRDEAEKRHAREAAINQDER